MISVLPGKGSVVGDALVRDARVKKVSFTGGTEVGRGIARLAAERIMPVSLELGGKSPTIVFDDADLDHAVNGVLYGIFSSSGESCIAGSRLFVQRGLYDAFVSAPGRAGPRAAGRRPASERTQMGPLITAQHRASIESYVALGREEGGRVLCGGERPGGAGREQGYYYLPTILDGLSKPGAHLPGGDFRAGAGGDALRRRGLAAGDGQPQRVRARRRHLDARLQARLARARARSRPARCGSIPTSSSRSRRRSAAGRTAARAARRAGSGIVEYMQQKSLYWGLNDLPLAWAN